MDATVHCKKRCRYLLTSHTRHCHKFTPRAGRKAGVKPIESLQTQNMNWLHRILRVLGIRHTGEPPHPLHGVCARIHLPLLHEVTRRHEPARLSSVVLCKIAHSCTALFALLKDHLHASLSGILRVVPARERGTAVTTGCICQSTKKLTCSFCLYVQFCLVRHDTWAAEWRTVSWTPGDLHFHVFTVYFSSNWK